MSTSELSEYELHRLARIASNKRKMEELGIHTTLSEMERQTGQSPAKKRKAPKPKIVIPEDELRRTSRPRAPINYSEDRPEPGLREPRGSRRTVFINTDDLDASQFAGPKIRSSQDSGKGVRIQGGRVYDSKHGVCCHWCRQKTLEDHVTCTAEGCGGGRRLPASFCKMCLRNRHGEDVRAADASGKWVCPGCRVSCGPGCKSCCNCGPCRKKAGLPPTRQVVREAREAGFSNVHDYLVHQVTGEIAAAIADRKTSAAWAAWMNAADEEEENGSEDEEQGISDIEDAEAADDTKMAEGAAGAAPVATILDAFPVVKAAAQVTGKATDKAAAAAARKQRVLRSMGLAPLSP